MSAAQLDTIMTQRANTVRRDGFTILATHGCPETGAGVILGKRRYGEGDEVAHYFRPRTHRRVHKTEKVTSNHHRLSLPERLDRMLKAEKAAKVAPHDLKVGEIMACIWGVTMQNVRFYRVMSIPSPRHVEVAQIGSSMASGDWMNGTMVPDEADSGEDGARQKFLIDMSQGEPRAKTASSIERMSRWNGRPVSVYSD